MFKFVVLCAFIASAAAEPKPDVLLASSPLAYSGGLVSSVPALYPSTYSNVAYASPALAAAPLAYSASLGHLIKKRSLAYVAPAPLATYPAAGWATSYAAAAPLATTYSAGYHAYPAPLYTTGAHLIKKRSAAVLAPSPYTYAVPSAYSAPLVTPYAATPYISSPLVSSYPLGYTPLIKK